jgi:non-ribosomal peptide synthetase component F
MQNPGVERESIVGICIDRSVEMALQSSPRCRRRSPPLDPEQSQERIAFMPEDAQPALALTKRSLPEVCLFPKETTHRPS